MSYLFRFTEKAKNDLQDLDKTVRDRIGKKLLHFASLDDIKSVSKKLSDFESGEYRLRVGDYRIIFDIFDKNIILIGSVKHRKNAYSE